MNTQRSIWIVGAIVVLAIAVATVVIVETRSSSSPHPSSGSPIPWQTDETPAYSPVPTETNWVRVITLKGSSAKNSPVFELWGGEQRIDWSVKTGSYGATSFTGSLQSPDPDNLELDSLGPADKPMHDRTYTTAPAGNYQLQVDYANAPFTVTVYEKR